MSEDIKTELLALLDKIGEATSIDMAVSTVWIRFADIRTAASAFDLITHSPTLRDHLRDEPWTHSPSDTTALVERLIASILQDVCELPDRTSPDDRPEDVTLSVSELRGILASHLSGPLSSLAEARDRLAEAVKLVDEKARGAEALADACDAGVVGPYSQPERTILDKRWHTAQAAAFREAAHAIRIIATPPSPPSDGGKP